MPRSWSWFVAFLPALALLTGACKESKKYPTAPAPKTITAPPPPEPMAMAATAEDDEDEELPRPTLRGPGPAGPPTSNGAPLPAMTGPAEPVRTINGHPEGPKAEVFNAVVNNAYGGAARCLAAAAGGGAVSLQVKMVVAPAGTVETAEVVAGAGDAALRTCICDVVKALTFPPFKGPAVTQVLPFTLVRQAETPPR